MRRLEPDGSGPGSRRIGMAGRRYLLAVVLLASVLHAISIARSLLPAQDGLKFIRIARQFQHDPWPDVVRETDQHPLYPALIAAIEPVIGAVRGTRPGHLADRRPDGGGPGLAGNPLSALRPDALALRRADCLPGGRHLRLAAGPGGGGPRYPERQSRPPPDSPFASVGRRGDPERQLALGPGRRPRWRCRVTWPAPRPSWRPPRWAWPGYSRATRSGQVSRRTGLSRLAGHGPFRPGSRRRLCPGEGAGLGEARAPAWSRAGLSAGDDPRRTPVAPQGTE